jgi:uncharacterized protein YeaO (DUF488 family)
MSFMANSIKLKSLKETKEESDGLRVLIARYRPRYLPKHKENWDEWWKDLAPSRELWKEYIKDKRIEWPEYARQFVIEIRNNPKAVKALQTLATPVNTDIDELEKEKKDYHLATKYRVVTLLCHCRDERHCHRSILKEMILEFTK